MREYSFYQWSVKDVEKHLETDIINGLTTSKATFRLQKDGLNAIENSSQVSLLVILLRQFSNLFVIILLVAATISYFIDGLNQAIILLVIVGINIGLGFFQEYKAEKSLEALKKSFSSSSKVIRDGKTILINSEEIVVGDIIALEPGDKIPADLRLIEEESLQINESSLTGESMPVSKSNIICPIDTPLADRKNMLFGSTTVLNGHGKGIVVKTGSGTEFGNIADMVSKADDTTPLEKQVAYIARVFSLIGLALAIIIFVLGYSRGYEIWKLLTFTIALLIAVVPESLPTVITLSLAVGVTRMSRKKAIVRRLAVIEALGCVDTIATDKTGTLTNNKLELEIISTMENGEMTETNFPKRNIDKNILTVLYQGLACSNIDLNQEQGYTGDPLEVAIAERVKTLQKIKDFKEKKYERVMEVPFDSDRKYMSVLVSLGGEKSLIAKGSPEKIIKFCSFKSGVEKENIIKEADRLSRLGYKVIALAEKNTNKLPGSILSGMRFSGLLAMIDEPAEGVKEAILKTISAGIRPIIITGDHPETAKFIANKIGLKVADDEIISENEFEHLSRGELIRALGKVKVFARATPSDKIKIVRMLQEMGYSVAVTGDGVNDAPALKEASVGIAMGIRGTDVARESSDIIISNDRYGTIVSAIEYGRTIYDNIKNIVTHLISGNFNEVLLVIVAFALGLPMPFVTLQILWINLIIESFVGLSLSFEKPDSNVLRSAPRSSKAGSLVSSVYYASYLALSTIVVSLSIFLWGLNSSVSKARTLVFFYIVFVQLVFALSIRSKKRIWESPTSFLENKYLLISIVAVILLQLSLLFAPIANIFSLSAPDFREWIVLIIAVIIAFFFAEIIRFRHDKHHSKKH